MRFARYLHISGNERMPYVAEYWAENISSFWLRPQRSIWQPASRPGSQPPGLSVRAYAALISASTVLVCLIFRQYTTHGIKYQIFFWEKLNFFKIM